MRVDATIMKLPGRLLIHITAKKGKEKEQQAVAILCRPDPLDPSRLVISLDIDHDLKGIYTSLTID